MSEPGEISPTPSGGLIEALEALPPRVRETREAMKRLGEAFDRIDAEARRPGEPPLRSAIAQYAREQLAAQPDTTREAQP